MSIWESYYIIPFKTIRTIWLGINYIFLLVIIFCFYKMKISAERRALVLFFGLAVFPSSIGWITSLEGGQNYLITVVLFSIIYLLYANNNLLIRIACGLLMAFALMVKPLYLPFILPLIINKKNRVNVISLVSSLLVFIAI